MNLKEWFKKRKLKCIAKDMNYLIEQRKKLSNQKELSSFSADSLKEDLSKTSMSCKGCGKIITAKKGNELHKLGVCSKRCRVLYVTNSLELLFRNYESICKNLDDLSSYVDDIFQRLGIVEGKVKRIVGYLIKCRKKQKIRKIF